MIDSAMIAEANEARTAMIGDFVCVLAPAPRPLSEGMRGRIVDRRSTVDDLFLTVEFWVNGLPWLHTFDNAVGPIHAKLMHEDGAYCL